MSDNIFGNLQLPEIFKNAVTYGMYDDGRANFRMGWSFLRLMFNSTLANVSKHVNLC